MRRIDDEADGLIAHEVNNIWMTIGNAVDGGAVNSSRTQRLCGTARGVDAIAKVLQSHSNRSNGTLIAVAHTDEDGALLR